MKYRQLGQTGLEISEIGFGTWGLGGAVNGAVAYGPTDDQESKLALKRAYELGITFYDTADIYGYGHSERLLGEALKEVRQKIIIATKVGFVDPTGAQDFSAKHIRQSIETSLKRLQTDYVDLYQLHNPPMEALNRDETILATLRSLQKEGKIRAFGISLRSPDDGLAAVSNFGLKAVQVNFNLVDQRAMENGLFDLCQREGVGVIVRTPLCFGFLTGAYSVESQFAESDHRHKWSARQVERWAGAYQLFAAAFVNRHNQTHAQIALRFCLSYPTVSTVIPGMLTTAHVEEDVSASQLGPFSEAERLKMEQIYQDNTFFVKEG
jgi:aryl-alcohol dehydrogenase-like predicted oxidoreductase